MNKEAAKEYLKKSCIPRLEVMQEDLKEMMANIT